MEGRATDSRKGPSLSSQPRGSGRLAAAATAAGTLALASGAVALLPKALGLLAPWVSRSGPLFRLTRDPFMDYLATWLGATAVAALVLGLAPARSREPVLALLSAAFLAVAVSPALAAAAVLGVGLLSLAGRLPCRWPRHLLVALGALAFYVALPRLLLDLPDGPSDFSGPGAALNFVYIGFFVRTFRRLAFCYLELCVERVASLPLLPLLNYLMGLPMLVGHSVTSSFADFLAGRPAGDPPAEVRRHGARTAAVCVACLAGWLGLRVLHSYGALDVVYRDPETVLGSPGTRLWTMALGWHLYYFLRRMGSEQLSVAAWRLLGQRMPDVFRNPLMAHSLVDYWRRWNAPWREFLMAWVYYPALLALGRRFGVRRWVFFAATFSTFAAGAVFDVLPRALFATADNLDLYVDFCLSLVLYHLLWGTLVGLEVFLRSGRIAEAPRRLPLWALPAAVALTFATASLCRLFEIPWLTLAEKWVAFQRMVLP